MTTIGDIVLVHFEEAPVFYARIADIDQDVKPGWFRVRLQALTVPVQDITWILREEYINGGGFTMGGKAVRLEKLLPLGPIDGSETEKKEPGGEPSEKPGKKGSEAKVVSLFGRKA